MNLLDHYILAVHSVKDITDEFVHHTGDIPNERLFEVDLTYDCVGTIERKTKQFWESIWKEAENNGCFLA